MQVGLVVSLSGIAVIGQMNEGLRAYITDWICCGFRLGFEYGSPCRPTRKNMKSALEHLKVVDEYLV